MESFEEIFPEDGRFRKVRRTIPIGTFLPFFSKQEILNKERKAMYYPDFLKIS